MGVEELKAQRKALAETEAKTGNPGAIPLTPKEILLDAREAIDKNPDKRVRWVNIKDPAKARARVANGYVRIPEAEGGKHLGDELALFAVPKKKYEETIAMQQQLNKDRLSQHNREMERMADEVAKVLRDKHGIRMSGEKLLVREGD